MKFQISNLGHIENATIEEKNLLVIIGDNGSGKTLLLESLALIKKTFSKDVNAFIDEASNIFCQNFTLTFDWEKIYKSFEDRDNGKENGIRFDPGFSEQLTEVLASANEIAVINNFFVEKIDVTTKNVKTLIEEKILFESETNLSLQLLDIPMIEKKESSFKADVRFHRDGCFIFVEKNEMPKIIESFSLKSLVNQENISKIKEEGVTSFYTNNIDEETLKKRIQIGLVKVFLKTHFDSYFDNNNILFLPSERNLYMDNAIPKIINEKNEEHGMRYSEYLFIKEYLDFRDSVKTFDFLRKVDDEYYPLFDGELTFGEDGEVSGLKKNDKEIKRTLFSTKLNRMIPYLIISNPLESYGDVIIEEPEAHLSLKSMNTLLTFFENLLKSRRLYITTHSDVFFARINNMLLKNKNISASIYELIINEDKSYLKKLEPNEVGYKVELFSDELNDLFEETFDIQNGEEE